MTVVNSNISAQLRTGSTTATTAYYGGLQLLTYATGAASGVADNNASAFSYIARTLNGKTSFSFNLYQPFLANKTVIHGNGFAGEDISGNYDGYHNSATSYDQFVTTVASGTFTGGTIYVYGYGIS